MRRSQSVVRPSLLEDVGIDQAHDVVQRPQIGSLEHRVHSSTRGDSFSGKVVKGAVEVSSGQRDPRVALVEPFRAYVPYEH